MGLMDMPNLRRFRKVVRAQLAGAAAYAMRGTANVIFRQGGKDLLSKGVRDAARGVAEGTAKVVGTAATPSLTTATEKGAAMLAEKAVKAVAERTTGVSNNVMRATSKAVSKQTLKGATRGATKELMRGAGKAATLGFVVDGAFAAYEAYKAHKDGKMTRAEARTYVLREATTGAVSTGAGVALAAGAVAVVGSLPASTVFVIGAGSALGVRHGVRWFLKRQNVAQVSGIEVSEVPDEKVVVQADGAEVVEASGVHVEAAPSSPGEESAAEEPEASAEAAVAAAPASESAPEPPIEPPVDPPVDAGDEGILGGPEAAPAT